MGLMWRSLPVVLLHCLYWLEMIDMQDIDNEQQYRTGLTQSLFNFGYALQNNEEKDIIIDKFNRLDFELNNYILTFRFKNLKSWFDLTDIELKIIAITFINSIEPETVSVFLRASWYENGPTLSLERIFILCQREPENKIDQINNIIKNSNALAWGLIRIEKSQLALIQPVTLADNIFNYLLGEGLSVINYTRHIHSLLPIQDEIISKAYGDLMHGPVDQLNIIKGLTKNERTLFVSKLAYLNESKIYECSINIQSEPAPDVLLDELRDLIVNHGRNRLYIYWPDLLACCIKYTDYLFILKILSHYENVMLFCDEHEDNVEQQVNLVALRNSLLPANFSYKEYALNNIENSKLSLSWRALSLAISNHNRDKILPLTIKEANKLANLYPILPGQIQTIYEKFDRLNLDETNVPLYQYCQNQCLKINSQSLGALAELFEPRYTLSSMVLTEKTIQKLSELINRIHYSDQLKKSLPDFMPGLKALFWGKPGTGKSMAAEAIAGELKLPLYKINLANIASKWIGETEKHLADVFDKAQKQNAVLLFDEADAVFSKRSEIESSHDKNANMGVSYLLQRMESYTGLLLLSTNFKGNLDSAFLRRFHSLVEFPMPDVNTREQLWRNAWAGDIKLDAQLDVSVLAQLHDFSPSQITNIAERSVLSALMKQAFIVDKLSLSAAIASELEKQDENYLASKKLNAWLVQ
jgi:AAA+ superfamily predicted ATPase